MEVQKCVAGAAWTRLAGIAACLASLAGSGCSFEQSPLVTGNNPSVAPPSSGDGDGSGSGPIDPSPPSTSTPDPGTTSQPPPASDAGPPPLAGSDAPAPADAGSDEPDEPLDSGAGDEPDTGTQHDAGGCEEEAPCVCGHERLETPDDPCAAPDCPLSECAPDEGCVLKRFGSSVYYFCSEGHSFDEAAEHCEQIDDMHLVYIEDEEEDDFVDGLVDGKAWIGATVEEGEWSWLDGTAFFDEEEEEPIEDAFVDWDVAANEPNGLGVGVGGGDVDCAIVWSDTEAWADTNCSALNGYVCEREL